MVRTITQRPRGPASDATVIPPAEIGVLRSVGGLVKDKTTATASEPSLHVVREAGDLTGQTRDRERRLDARG